MNTRFKRSFYQAPEGDAAQGGAAGAAGAAVGAGAGSGGAAGAAGDAGSQGKQAGDAKTGDDAGDSAAGYWPNDWRTKVAGDDEKEAKRLTRFASPADLYKQNRELEKKLSSGSLKPVLAKDATPEDIAAYHKEHGIPETPDKYDLSDLKVEVQDKEFMAEILKVAHANHQKPEQIKPVIKAFYDLAAKAREKAAEEDKQYAVKAEDELRKEWGQDYRRHTNLINGLMDLTGDPEFNKSLMEGRLADGTLIKNSPAMQRFMLQLALINNPVGVVVPSHNGNPMQGLEDEIKKIETTMKTNRKEYDRDAGMQSRLRELYSAREKMKERKAA